MGRCVSPSFSTGLSFRFFESSGRKTRTSCDGPGYCILAAVSADGFDGFAVRRLARRRIFEQLSPGGATAVQTIPGLCIISRFLPLRHKNSTKQQETGWNVPLCRGGHNKSAPGRIPGALNVPKKARSPCFALVSDKGSPDHSAVSFRASAARCRTAATWDRAAVFLGRRFPLLSPLIRPAPQAHCMADMAHCPRSEISL